MKQCNIKSFKLLFFLLLSITSNSFAQSNGVVDTIFYTSDWSIAPTEEFATYKRIIFTSNDSTKFKNMYRDFYTSNGSLYSEGSFSSKSSGGRLVLNGNCTKYYKNGNTKERCVYQNGVYNGEYTSFYENGYLEKQCIYKNGKIDGIMNKFDKDSTYCTQIKYSNGEISLPYYTVSNRQGLCSRYRVTDNELYFEDASSDEMIQVAEEGLFSIAKNGVNVTLAVGEHQFYGKSLQVKMLISNYTLDPISFNPKKIAIEYIKENRKGEVKSNKLIHPYTAEEYTEKINNKQELMMGLYAFAATLHDASAAYRTSTTTTNTKFSIDSNTSGSVYAYGSGGYASAYFGGRTSYDGTITSTSTTTTYDPYRAYQVSIITANTMRDFQYSANRQLEEVYSEYLKPTIINSAQSLYGNIDAKFKYSFDKMRITVFINDTPYVFEWDNPNKNKFYSDSIFE